MSDVSRTLIFVIVISLAAIGNSYADDSLIGKRVYPKTNSIPIQNGNVTIGSAHDLVYPVFVDGVEGDWIQVWARQRILSQGWISRGNVCIGEEAIPYFSNTLAMYPWDQHALHMRSLALIEAKRFDEAVKDARDLVNQSPTKTHWSWLAYRLDSAGRTDEALVEYARVLSMDQRMFWPRYNRAELYVRMRDWEKAISDVNTCIAYHPNHASGFLLRSRISKYFNNPAMVAADLESAHCISPANQRTTNELAWIRATCPEVTVRNGQESLTLAKSLCELTNWKKSGYLETLAAAYGEVGQFDDALKMARLAVEQNGNQPSTRCQKMIEEFEKRMAYRVSLNESESPPPVPAAVPAPVPMAPP